MLNESDAYQAEVRLLAERQDEAKATIREAIRDVNLAIDAAVELRAELEATGKIYQLEERAGAEAPRALFDSNETWAEQTRRLREHKALDDGDDDQAERG